MPIASLSRSSAAFSRERKDMALFGLNVDIDDGLCATVIWFGRKCGGGAIGRSHEAQAVELAFDWFVKM